MNRIMLSAIALALSTMPLSAQDIPLSKILVEKEGWRELAKGLREITFLQAEVGGTIGIYQGPLAARIGLQGIVEKAQPPSDDRFSRDHKIVISSLRQSYFIVQNKHEIILHQSRGGLYGALKMPGFKSPSCLTLWPDEGHLVIGESDGAYLWAVRIEKDGSFGPGDRYYSLRTRPNEKMHVTAMTMDAGYLLYACTPLGIQVFDPTGRLSGVIAAPSKEPLTAITIGGEKADTLFVASGERIYGRKIQGKAIYTLKKDQ